MNYEERKERYTAVLMGSAIGDALGMPVEGWKPQQIARYAGRIEEFRDPVIPIWDDVELAQDEYGPLKKWTREFKKGEFTDDTILTLATAESLIACNGFDVADCMQRMVAEYTQRLRPDGTCHGGFGGTTMESFKHYLETGSLVRDPANPGGPGNGTCMKSAPFGIWGHAVLDSEFIDGAVQASRLTHQYAPSITAGAVQAAAVYSCLKGSEFTQFIGDICTACFANEVIPADRGIGLLYEKINWIERNRDLSVEEAYSHLGNSSHVMQSYPFALFMFVKYFDDPWNGLVETVNWGGDCDTTAAMFGALAGARHGVFYPSALEEQLLGRECVIAAAEGLARLAKD